MWIFTLEKFSSGASLPVFADFVSASPFAQTFELNIINSYHAAEAGKDLEREWLKGGWVTINHYMEQLSSEILNSGWPRSSEQIKRVPISVSIVFDLNGFITQFDYGKLGDVKVLLYKKDEVSSAIATLIRGKAIQGALRSPKADLNSPPHVLKIIVGYLLSYWNNSDRFGSAEYTDVPLEKIVAICPVDNGNWLWDIEGIDLNLNWEPEWISLREKQKELSSEAQSILEKCTRMWKYIPNN